MSRPKPEGSRRRPTPSSRRTGGVGPENLPLGSYYVDLIWKCAADDAEMGRARRRTAEAEKSWPTEAVPIPGTGVLPIQRDGEHLRWRPGCPVCGRDVMIRNDLVETALGQIATPWARRTVTVHV